MESPTSQHRVARFGMFEADLDTRELTKSGNRVRLQDQPFQILALLLDQPGEIITREQIQERLWPGDTFVEFDAGLNTAMKKLRTALGDAADNPRFIETVPRRGYRFVAPVSFPEPKVEATNPPSIPKTEPVLNRRLSDQFPPTPRPPRGARPWVLVAALVAGGGLGVYLYLGGPRRGAEGTKNQSSFSVQAQMRPSVAVLGFRNASGSTEAAWLSTALSEMMSTELASGGKLRAIAGEDVARAKLDLSLADADSLAKDTLSHLKSNLNADYVVLGSYTDLGKEGKGHIRLDMRLQDTSAGDLMAEEAVTGNEAELFDLVSRAGARLRSKLGLASVSLEDAVRVRTALPSNPEAARLYSEGLAKLRVFDALAARDLLVQAVKADPKYPLAHSALSTAWSGLGYVTNAQQEAQRALDLSSTLSSEERLSVEGLYHETAHEWPKAMETYRTLWITYPDNLDYGLRLASTQTLGGHATDALTTVAELRQLPSAARNDPRVDIAEDIAAEKLGDFQRSQRAAAAAVAKGRAEQARLLIAEARSDEGWAWERLGQFDKGDEALQEAQGLFLAEGNKRGAAVAINLRADLLADKGDSEAAQKAYAESIAMCREIGNQKCLARSINGASNLLHDHGKLKEAAAGYEQVYRINRLLGLQSGMAASLGNLANVLDESGDLAGARKKQEEGLQIFVQIDDKRGTASTLNNLGNLLDEMGDLPGSMLKFQQALKLHRESGHRRGVAFTLSGMGLVLEEQNQLAEARARIEESIAIRKEMGDPANLAYSWVFLADISMQEGKAAEAAKLASDAAEQFVKAKDPDAEATANAYLARALLAQGKIAEAQKASDHAMSLASKGELRPPRFDAGIAAAEIEAASGKSKEAMQELQAILSQTKKYGYVGYEMQARLALGRIEMKSGKIAARSHLEALEKDATAQGYSLIAHNAQAARG